MTNDLDTVARARAQRWLDGEFDESTKRQVRQMLDSDPAELRESFYRDLEFGTGGLRGIMGAGTNRMNIYTVGMATQGLSNYLIKCFAGQEIKVAVSHDSRHGSREFAERVADIFASNGFKVFLFDDLRPTPELSFAIRELGCHSGVMVTASHNPSEYNGYKAYWSDGSQVTSPHDTNIIAEVGQITDISQIRTGANPDNITPLDRAFDEIYLNKVHSLALAPEAVSRFHDMKIVYTPLHGAGVRLVPESLRRFGFTNVTMVPEQSILDGDFPTVVSPNPEERATMKMAIDLAEEIGAELVLATDPDADRLAIAVRDERDEFVLLNGNQTCALLTSYMLSGWAERGKITGREFVVKTIVTSEMIPAVAQHFGARCYDCLTGFKYIAKVVRDLEGAEQYIGGGEESFGFMAGDFVRDKDGVSACSLAAEAAAWARSKGMTLYGWLKSMYVQYGFYKEGLVSVTRKGIEGVAEIAAMMAAYRETPPATIGGSPVVTVRDFLSLEEIDTASGTRTPMRQERSDVLQFLTADGTKVSVRPSGTEPKIKFYFGVRAPLPSVDDFDAVQTALDARIESIKTEMQL
ncbi:MAG: phospho-sugar mutase [Alistipes sp.]|jgi:phosphoglucomutase|nr:phospho-sugar mutase [Alistipes sp.]